MSCVCLSSSGCIIPPAIDVEAGNTPPQVVFQRTFPPSDPGNPLVVKKTPEGERLIVTTFTVGFRDPDPEPVWLRLFVNSDYATFIEPERQEPPTADGERSGQLSVEGLCDGLLVEGTPDVEIYLTDTEFVDEGEDLRVTKVIEGRKGAREHVRWRIACED